MFDLAFNVSKLRFHINPGRAQLIPRPAHIQQRQPPFAKPPENAKRGILRVDPTHAHIW